MIQSIIMITVLVSPNKSAIHVAVIFVCPDNIFDRISRHFRSICNIIFFQNGRFWRQILTISPSSLVCQWLHQILIFDFPIFAKINGFLRLWVITGRVKYVFNMGIGVTVTWNTSFGVRWIRLRPKIVSKNKINFWDIITIVYVT